MFCSRSIETPHMLAVVFGASDSDPQNPLSAPKKLATLNAEVPPIQTVLLIGTVDGDIFEGAKPGT
jgi:hypothetical protein